MVQRLSSTFLWEITGRLTIGGIIACYKPYNPERIIDSLSCVGISLQIKIFRKCLQGGIFKIIPRRDLGKVSAIFLMHL